jgi:hypothetical protein
MLAARIVMAFAILNLVVLLSALAVNVTKAYFG